MTAPLFVLGHRNPDSDSICAAIGYAALLRLQGQSHARAARQGVPRKETAYILQRFHIPVPELVTDVRPRVRDVMTSPAVTATEETSLHQVGQLLQDRRVRAVPIVNDDGHLVGVTGIEDFARGLISGFDNDQLDRVGLHLDSLVQTLNGQVLVAAPERILRDKVMIAAMQIDSMLKRLEPDLLLVVGDREDVQRAAIEFGVGALVVTGDAPVAPAILDLARERRVTVIAVPEHTYTAVRLIQLSSPVRYVMRTDVRTCGPDDAVDDVRETLQAGVARSLVVVDSDRQVVGLISRSNLLRTVRRQIVLVDHNERSQSVAGIEEADVVGVIDHHRVADFQTRIPPFMRLEPVGSTSTLVAKLYHEAGLEIEEPIAGVLLAGILADTLLFRGPTTTDEDHEMAADLAQRTGINPEELGRAILDLASDVSGMPADRLITTDFKDFNVDGRDFGIGVLETTNSASALARSDDLLVAMRSLQQQGYECVMFAIVDIIKEKTTVLIQGPTEAVASAFERPVVDGQMIELPGIISRKKHIVPLLGSITRRMQAAGHPSDR